MLFSRVAAYLTFVLTLGILAVAKPVELESRANAIENVVSTLKSKTDALVPQIKSAAASKRVSAATVTPLMNELIAAFNNAHSSLTQVEVGELKKRQTTGTVTTTLAGVISDVTGALAVVPGLPDLAGLPALLVSLDVAITGLITGLNITLVGLSVAIAGLLGDIGGLLAGLGLGLLLGLLGI